MSSSRFSSPELKSSKWDKYESPTGQRSPGKYESPSERRSPGKRESPSERRSPGKYESPSESLSERKSSSRKKKKQTPKWYTYKEIFERVKKDKDTYYCMFVCSKGEKVGKYCGKTLSVDEENCGKFYGKSKNTEWVPHSPEEELIDVKGKRTDMRCKECWSATNTGERHRKKQSKIHSTHNYLLNNGCEEEFGGKYDLPRLSSLKYDYSSEEEFGESGEGNCNPYPYTPDSFAKGEDVLVF